MGFNTVVLILNDHADELSKSPHALAWAICNPPSSDNEVDLNRSWWPQVTSVAKEWRENIQALRVGLKVLPTFHADDKHVLIAGWNQLIRPKYGEYKVTHGARTRMVVDLPEWWDR